MYNSLAIALILTTAVTVGEWELKKDKDGITIHTRSVEGSKLDEFKGSTVLPGTRITAVLGIITDVEGYGSLFPDCSSAEIITRTGPYDTVHYIKTEAPFPVSDRDGVYEQRTTLAANGRMATVLIRAVPDRLPLREGLVRIPRGTGSWELLQVGDDVHVEYRFHGDPGGSVPAWLANSFIVDHPFSTLKNLKALAAR